MPPLHDAQCVFGGSQCSFQHMLKFLERETRHQFIFGGSVWILSHRISNKSRASVPIHEDVMVVVGRKDRKSDIRQSFINVFRPFDKETWALIVGFFLAIFLLRVFFAYIFAQPRTFTNVCRHILFDFSMSKNSERVRLLNLLVVGVLVFVVSVSSIVLILFYEITVVNFVLRNSPKSLQKDLSELSISDRKSYIVVKDDGTELFFKSLVDPQGNISLRNPPWQHCDNPDDCYNKLQDQSHPAQFFFTFEAGLLHTMKNKPGCANLVIFETVSPISTVSSGWYYGPSLPRDKQIAIDKAILNSRSPNKVGGIISEDKSSAMCRTPTEVSRVQPDTIGWLLLIIAGSGFVTVAVAVCLAFLGKGSSKKARRNARDTVRMWGRPLRHDPN